jgi:hypothetical protein
MVTSEIVVPHPAAEAEEIYRRWIRFLDEEFLRHCSMERRSEIVRDQLIRFIWAGPTAANSTSPSPPSCPATSSISPSTR